MEEEQQQQSASPVTLSVVIPVRNRPEQVIRALQSVRLQQLLPDAIIVVDNGSTDDTAAAVHTFFDRWRSECPETAPRLTLVEESRPGAAAARNRGLAAVDTEWTMFFDSDDIMLPRHIRRAVDAVQAEPAADIVGWDVRYAGPGAEHEAVIKPFEPQDAAFHNLFHATFATQRYMARTALFGNAGGWREDVPIWNDIELGARLLALHPHIVKRHGTDVIVYIGDDSITGRNFSSRAGQYDKALDAISATLGREYSSWIALKRTILAACMAREGAGDAARTEMTKALSLPLTARERLLLRVAYTYTRFGGRGIARLLRRVLKA